MGLSYGPVDCMWSMFLHFKANKNMFIYLFSFISLISKLKKKKKIDFKGCPSQEGSKLQMKNTR